MNEQQRPAQDEQQPWNEDAQRSSLPRYLSQLDALALSLSRTAQLTAEPRLDWARRELELATHRIYAREEDFEHDMLEVMRQVRDRLTDGE